MRCGRGWPSTWPSTRSRRGSWWPTSCLAPAPARSRRPPSAPSSPDSGVGGGGGGADVVEVDDEPLAVVLEVGGVLLEVAAVGRELRPVARVHEHVVVGL